MADGDCDYSLMSSLRSSYPNVPMKVVLKVIDTCKRDHEKCKQLLDIEKTKYPTNEMKLPGVGNETPHFNNDHTKVSTRIKELPVSHEPTPSAKPNLPERHVSTFEKSVVNIPRTQELTKGPTITKSISYSGSNAQFSSMGGGAHLPSTSGHTAPPDFAPFFQGIQNPTSIPNITCKTFNHDNSKAAASNQTRPNASPSSDNANRSFLSASSPGEHRRPVKVINNPPGSLSGGSVSPAMTPSNSRHFRMQFGDTGGTCTVQTNHPIQRYASTPNVSQQHFRSEYHTEATVPQSIHSSSIVVATSSHSAQPTIDRRLSGEAAGSEVSRTSTNPFHFSSPNISADYQPSPGAYVWNDGRPLSTPVQASSPGISHSRPVFKDYGLPPRAYNETSYPNYNYIQGHPGAINYGSQFGAEFPPAPYNVLPPTSTQEQNYPNSSHFNQQPKHQGYHSPPSNLNLNTAGGAYNPTSSYSHFNPSAVGTMAYSVQQPPSRPLPYSHHYPPPSLNLSGVGPPHLPRSPSTGLPQPRLSNRTNSSESSDHQDVDQMRPNHLPNMGSRVSSQSSVGSDSSMRGVGGADLLDRGRSGSIHEETEADYIRALLQHQRNCLQKLNENTEVHSHQLLELRAEVNHLERGAIDSKNHMHQSFPSPIDISRLCEKNRELQTDIQLFVNEIEMYKSGHTPFNDINPREQQNFYANMPTGQQDLNFSGTNLDVNRSSTSPSRSPPPRPPPPIPVRQRSTEPTPPGNSDLFNRVPPVPPPQPTTNSGDSEEGEQWSCSACTFQNHPALKKCEMCELERFPEPKTPVRGAGAGAAGVMNSNPHPQLPSTLPHRPAATTAEWVGGVQHRPGHHQHHRAGT